MTKNGVKLLNKWHGHVFQSSQQTTKEFEGFSQDYKKMLKEAIGPDFEIEKYSIGHFYISGYFKHIETGNLIYFACSDVRAFPEDWFERILIRTAVSTTDFRHGPNNYSYLSTLNLNLLQLQ